jgi:hypothetical protein
VQGNYECAPSVLAEQMSACCRLQDGQLLLDGFVLHRQKNTYGPAQQAHILMRSLKALEGRRDVQEFSVTGEPWNHRADRQLCCLLVLRVARCMLRVAQAESQDPQV